MFSGDRSHSIRPRMRPRLTPLTRLTMKIHPHDVASGSVGQGLLGLLACLKAGTLISGRSDRYLHVKGDGSEVELLVGWPRGGEDVDPCIFF